MPKSVSAARMRAQLLLTALEELQRATAGLIAHARRGSEEASDGLEDEASESEHGTIHGAIESFDYAVVLAADARNELYVHQLEVDGVEEMSVDFVSGEG